MTEYDFTPQDTPPQHEYDEGWFYSRSPKYWFDSGYNQGRRAGYHDAHVDGFQTPRQLHELGFNEGYERGHNHGLTAANAQMRQLNNRISQLESENDRLYQKLPTQSIEDQKRKSYNDGHIDGYKQGSRHLDEAEYWKSRERDARENAYEQFQQQIQQLNQDWQNAINADRNWFWNKINELETELARQDVQKLKDNYARLWSRYADLKSKLRSIVEEHLVEWKWKEDD